MTKLAACLGVGISSGVAVGKIVFDQLPSGGLWTIVKLVGAIGVGNLIADETGKAFGYAIGMDICTEISDYIFEKTGRNIKIQ